MDWRYEKLKGSKMVSYSELSSLVAKYKLKPKDNKNRRREIASIGCQLSCLSEEDVVFILTDENDMRSVERLFTRRKLA